MPPPMGQPITVVEKQSSNPGILRFETNRPLSGLSHERYAQAPDPLLDRPVDELARRLFAAGGVEHVHINGSVVTVTLGRGQTGAGLADIVRGLFLHYTETPLDETVDPPTDEGDRTPDMTADPGDTPAAQEAEAGVAPPTTEPAAEIVADAPVVDEPEA
jgi:hypothetical protein